MFKMEKHIQRQDSNLQFNKNIPGCFWSIFNTVDYHPWHNVKKMLPYKRHSRSKGGPKPTVNGHHTAEVPEHLNDGDNSLMCTAESCPMVKRSGAAHGSEVKAKEMSEVESKKYWKINFSSKRRLIRTNSIHHLEPSLYFPESDGEIGDGRVTSQQKTPKKLAAFGKKSRNSLDAMDTEDHFSQKKVAIRSTSITEKSNGVKQTLETKQINRNISSRSFKEDADIQEIFKANKKLFAELLQGADGKRHLQTPQNLKSTASLAKSRSFPAPGLARNKYRKLSSLQHKQNESFPKVQRSVSGPQPSKLVESESPKEFHEDMMPFDPASTSFNNTRQQTSSPSLGPNRGLKHGGWNQLVIKRFNLIKHKIRHSFKERKKGNNQKSPKGIPTADSSGHEHPLNREEARESFGSITSKDGLGTRGYSEADSSENDNIGNGVQTSSRIASLNASVERYTQLSQYGFNGNREAKSYHSHSLRLTSEDKIVNSEKPRKPFGRNLSMPDIDLFCTLFTDPPHGILRTEKPKKGLVHSNTDKNIRIDPNSAHLFVNVDRSEQLDSDSQSIIEKGDENMPIDYSDCSNVVVNDEGAAWIDEPEEKIPHRDISESKHHQVLGSECRLDDFGELSHIGQILDLETCYEEDAMLDLSYSEGEELDPGCSIANDLEPSDDQSDEVSTEALTAFEGIAHHEIIGDTENISNYLYLHSQSESINNADFNYMRYILQLSSFIESGNTIVRPLSSSMFDGEEAHFYKKLECYWMKVDKNSDHQLLLDLVYETLHSVFERSLICFLKSFSLKCRIRPMSLGQYLLEEVREKVAWYLCLGPELDQSLDDVVGRDLRKGEDWMNLQSETEYLVLELEELILDDLLDEIICF